MKRAVIVQMEKGIKLNKRKIGAAYEQAVGGFLEQEGYIVLEYNYRCPAGEIDIIAKDGECLVFCEVKYRKDKRKGDPLEAVDSKKQRIIYRCASHYLTIHGKWGVPCRFDVIGIESAKLTHIKDAFCG